MPMSFLYTPPPSIMKHPYPQFKVNSPFLGEERIFKELLFSSDTFVCQPPPLFSDLGFWDFSTKLSNVTFMTLQNSCQSMMTF